MRLICPNCGAQYEVDDGMVPADGRDVQCSNCATTWFQQGARRAAPAADAAAPVVRKPRGADAATLDVLREEAAHEARMREADPIETQADLGLEEPAPRRDPVDDIEEIDEAPEVPIAAPVAPPEGRPGRSSRRDLLPDIEEINSTLRPDDRAGDDEDLEALEDEVIQAKAERRRGGARLGFGLVLLSAVVAVVVYVSAPSIAAQVPEAAPYVTTYASWVDGLRLALDDAVGRAIEQIQAIAGQ